MNRRDFLKKAGILAGVGLAAPAALKAAVPEEVSYEELKRIVCEAHDRIAYDTLYHRAHKHGVLRIIQGDPHRVLEAFAHARPLPKSVP